MNKEVKNIVWHNSIYAYLLILITFLACLANVIYSIGEYRWPAGDESFHYSYSDRYYDSGNLNREEVSNYNSTTPLVVLNVIAERVYQWYSGDLAFNKVAARSVQVVWYLLLVSGMGVATYYLAGAGVAWWAVFLLLLDPNLNSHSALIGSDVPFVAMSLWVLLSIFYYLDNPNYKRASLIGISYGLAFCTKYFAAFYVIPIGLALLTVVLRTLFRKGIETPKPNKLRSIVSVGLHGLLIILFLTIIVNCAYSFVGTGQAFKVKVWYSGLFKILVAYLGDFPMLWPLPFISGFDHQLGAERSMAWNVVLLGRSFPNGVWYYFLLNWLIKTSIGVVFITLIFFLSSPKILSKWRTFKSPWVIIFLSWALFLFYFSFIFRTQVGLRYAYMCLPLLYILIAGYIVNNWNTKLQSRVACLLFFIAGYEEIPYFGNGIAFTNSIISDKLNAYTWTADSNIDWFHNYQSAQGEARELLGDYYLNSVHILPGENVFTLNVLTGVMHNFRQHEWVRKNLKPLKHFQHTHFWYHVSQAKFDEFINSQRTYSEAPNAKEICSNDYVYKNLNEYPSPKLEKAVGRRLTLYSGCLEVSEESLFEVKVKKGSSVLGNYVEEHDCRGSEVEAGNSAWFRFKPGMHPICANLYDSSEFEFVQHSGKAKFALRIRP